MSNKNATLKTSLQFTDGSGNTVRDPVQGTSSLNSPYQGEQQGTIDVPDTTAADTEYAASFGAVAGATMLEIENKTGQDIKAKINDPASATGTLASGVADIALANVAADHLAVKLVTSHGTAGVLSVKRKDDATVTVQSWLSGTGIQASDVSDVQVYNLKDFYPFQLSANGKLLVACPTLPVAGQVASAGVKTTATQSGAGTVSTRVFGDPV
jgi:hypothetical protein